MCLKIMRGEFFCLLLFAYYILLVAWYFFLVERYFLLGAYYFSVVARQEIMKDVL